MGLSRRGSHILYADGTQMAVRSALCASRRLPPGRYPVLLSVTGSVNPRPHGGHAIASAHFSMSSNLAEALILKLYLNILLVRAALSWSMHIVFARHSLLCEKHQWGCANVQKWRRPLRHHERLKPDFSLNFRGTQITIPEDSRST
jgi:hypothetical protein